MSSPLRGRVHGASIELDAPVPELEGKRVLVVLESLGDDEPSDTDLRDAWDAWGARGDDGPI